MTWTVPEIDREQPPNAADERTMLDGFLDYQRQTLLTKCAGLTAEQPRTASARHNGHADLIRERLDGVTGQ